MDASTDLHNAAAAAAASRIRRDVEVLAGDLLHRGSNTGREKEAAEYIRSRLAESTPDVSEEPFESPETPALLFAAYYAEYVLVCLVAYWFPLFASVYAAVVFALYLAEFTSYRLMSRLMPQFESQNVVGRLLGSRPRRQVVFVAHYDSTRYAALHRNPVQTRLRLLHHGVVAAMLVVAVTCALEGLGAVPPGGPGALALMRYIATAYLMGGALFLLIAESRGEYTRGTADNATGVAGLLELSRRLARRPIADADLTFVATGSKESWLYGMHAFVTSREFDPDTTYFINLDRLAGGPLQFTRGEGMLHVFKTPRELYDRAADLATAYGAVPAVHRGVPSDALVALARGYKAITIMTPCPEADSGPDAPAFVDYAAVGGAIDFAEALARSLGDAEVADAAGAPAQTR